MTSIETYKCLRLRTQWRYSLLVILAAVCSPAPASTTASRSDGSKQQVTSAAYRRWNRIEAPMLSPNGLWIAYTLSSASGDGTLVLRATRLARELRFPRGSVFKPESIIEVARNLADVHDGRPTYFTADSRHLIFQISSRPPDELHSANDVSHVALGIVDLPGGQLTTIPRVLSFKLPNGSGKHIAYTLDGEQTARRADVAALSTCAALPTTMQGSQHDADATEFSEASTLVFREFATNTEGRQLTTTPRGPSFKLPNGSGKHIANTLDREQAARRVDVAALSTCAALPTTMQRSQHTTEFSQASTLVLREFATNTEVRIQHVGEFLFDEQGRYLAYSILSPRAEISGVYIRRLSDGQTVALLTGSGAHRALTFDEAGEHFAFLSNVADHGGTPPRYSLYHARVPASAAQLAVKAKATSDGWRISPNAGLRFTQMGKAIVAGIARDLKPSDETEERAKFTLWHWKEPLPLPQADRRTLARTAWHTAVYELSTKRWTRLGTDTAPEVLLTDDARYAIAVDHSPYRLQASWGDRAADLSVIDVETGSRRLLLRRFEAKKMHRPFGAYVALSPGSRYLLYFHNGRWFSYGLRTGKLTDLTGTLPQAIQFDDEIMQPYGIAGWTRGDRRVLIYGRRDIWAFDPSGLSVPRSITDGIGLKDNIIFRLWADHSHRTSARLRQKTAPVLDERRSLLLAATDRDTMESGVWRAGVGSNEKLERLLMVAKRVTPLQEAADQYLLSIETFREFPDLWTGARFDTLEMISNANPHQGEYRWGTAELIEFTSSAGAPLKGVLYKPDSFDSSKRYPMIVSVYTHYSEDLHRYYPPAPLDSADAVFAAPSLLSNGYLVFQPDIKSVAPYPGQSALFSVVPAVDELINRGFVDPERIGLTGHSFGGYEAAYIITQTNMFRCAIESAGISNTVSGYGIGIINSGPAFFEHGQGKHGASIWDKPFVYIQNSPVFHANRVFTPLLILHNDRETAVPFSQAKEFYTALRRNGKEVYLISYDGEDHNLVKYINRLDWDMRFHQFFDHCLRGGGHTELDEALKPAY